MSTRIMYLRASNGHPVGCIAIEIERTAICPSVRYSVSTLHPNDKFNRTLAKNIAIGRLTVETSDKSSHKHYLSGDSLNFTGWYNDPSTRRMTIHDVSMGVMTDIVRLGIKSFPSRVVKSAKLWLRQNSTKQTQT